MEAEYREKFDGIESRHKKQLVQKDQQINDLKEENKYLQEKILKIKDVFDFERRPIASGSNRKESTDYEIKYLTQQTVTDGTQPTERPVSDEIINLVKKDLRKKKNKRVGSKGKKENEPSVRNNENRGPTGVAVKLRAASNNM